MPLPENVYSQAIIVTLATLGATWLGFLIARFFAAPANLFNEQKAKVKDIEQRLAKKESHINLFEQLMDLWRKGENLHVAPSEESGSWAVEVERCLREAGELGEVGGFSTLQTHEKKLEKLRMVIWRIGDKARDA